MGIIRIYLDTCIVIYLIEKHPIYASRIEALINNLSDSILCFSPLVRLESLVMPFRTNDSQLERLYEIFFKAQNLLTMPPEVFDQAARLRANFPSLKTPDALHLATAIFYNCDEFWTNDDRLNKIAPSLVKRVL